MDLQPPFSRGHHRDPDHGYGWARFSQFPSYPGEGVNGGRNMVSLASIRVEKRVAWRVDGLIVQEFGRGRPEIMALPHPFARGRHPDPNRG